MVRADGRMIPTEESWGVGSSRVDDCSMRPANSMMELGCPTLIIHNHWQLTRATVLRKCRACKRYIQYALFMQLR